ncbi:HET-domain-containing protein [Coniophora puteana RWD-64-598 SS2]|uniref:HET-domain-containing protein n=1 Tax=Coniophora puteana (strain RWD-64-598) TaxID=741705 RepID=A0A5M3N7T8_CONPW|nr:HET-domain-containing protein [Coniophora puteana RWD-64-598 SS2]EIW87358.1 HET-domain-containing protein [Coniophora puteana RWD-64-598 SS2]
MPSPFHKGTNLLQRLGGYIGLSANAHPHEDSPLCDTCSKLDLRSMLPYERIGSDPVTLGTLPNILDKASTCGLCNIVASLVRRTWLLDTNKFNVDLSEVKVLVGSSDTGSLDGFNPANSFPLTFSYRPPEVLAAQAVASSALTPAIQIMEDTALALGHRKLYHGRMVGETVDVELVKRWLHICEHTHGDVCGRDWWRGNDGLPSYVRMVDVEDMAVVSTPPNCRYLALSYRWGIDGASYWTCSTNISARSAPGGLPISILPGTISDVVLLARKIGVRYVWIDALCISQDDSSDKALQIGVMERIYACSLLTVFAVGGDDAHAPLMGLRAGTRVVGQETQPTAYVQGLHLSAALPGLDEALVRSSWDTRGWTLQEIVLSRRRLVFTAHQVYFECGTDLFAEGFSAETEGPSVYGPKTHQLTRARGKYAFIPRRSPWSPGKMWDSMDMWMHIVKVYTTRSLTNEGDIVIAISALATAFGRAARLAGSGDGKAIRYGMPVQELELVLLWHPHPDRALERRSGSDGDTMSSPWPSWAWSGWRGPVRYGPNNHFLFIYENNDVPAADESLVERWSLVDDDGALIRLEVKHTSPVLEPRQIVAESGRLARHISWDDAWVPPVGQPLKPGTLVFRTMSAQLQVRRLVANEITSEHRVEGTEQAVFVIVTGEADGTGSRVILPKDHPSPATLQFVVVCRAHSWGPGESLLAGENASGPIFWLYVLALRAQPGIEVKERLGSGIVHEKSWMESGKWGEEVILLR